MVPANVDERETLWVVVDSIYGLLIGDKGYLRFLLKQELLEQGVELWTPLRRNRQDTRPKAFVKSLTSLRRLVETVIGQLAGQFHIEKVCAGSVALNQLLCSQVALTYDGSISKSLSE